jgi:hypothetical protein
MHEVKSILESINKSSSAKDYDLASLESDHIRTCLNIVGQLRHLETKRHWVGSHTSAAGFMQGGLSMIGSTCFVVHVYTKSEGEPYQKRDCTR